MEIWLCTPTRCFSSTYMRHVSYALSSNPGPTAEWTFIAAPMTACPISSSITFASFAYPSRPLRYLSFARFLSRHLGGALGPPAFGRRRDLDQAVHVDAGQVHVVGVDRAARQDRLLDLDHGDPRRHRHQRVEIALRAPEAEVARLVGLVGADEGVIERQRVFEEVFAALKAPRLALFGELGADRGGRVERRDAGAGGAHALGQGALRHQLGVNEALLVILAEDELLRGAGRRGERADHLLDLIVGDQGAHVGSVGRQGRAAPRAVRDAGQVFGALLGQRPVEVDRHADDGKPAKPDHRAVGDVADGVGEGGVDLGFGNVTFPHTIPAEAGTHGGMDPGLRRGGTALASAAAFPRRGLAGRCWASGTPTAPARRAATLRCGGCPWGARRNCRR